MPTFRSDNNAGVCPEALEAITEAAAGSATGYGDDDSTARAERAFQDLFGCECRVFFVATGTAANCLAVAALSRPWERLLCYEHSHLNEDESTAPERFTGCRLTTVGTAAPWSSRLTASDVRRGAAGARGDVHQPQPGVFSFSNLTELGEAYTPEDTAALCGVAHEHGYRVHVDGARFANAVAANMSRTGNDSRTTARQLTVDAGVDALSFGGTKNGLAFGEAIVFFPRGDGTACERAAEALPFLRKSTGHLLSKHRYVSAPFAHTIESGAWIVHAVHANTMGRTLADGMTALGYELAFPADASAVFVRLTPGQHAALQERGHGYYPFGPAEWSVYRLMCSYDTRAEDVDALLADLRDVQPL